MCDRLSQHWVARDSDRRVANDSDRLSQHAILGGKSCGVATIRKLLKNTGLVCRISSLLQGSFAKETCNFKEPTNRSYPISHGDRLLQHWVARERRVSSHMRRL